MRKRRNKGQTKSKNVRLESLPVIRPKVACIDIGSREHWVCGPALPDGGANVRVFFTTTSSLNKLADWLIEQGVESVAHYALFWNVSEPIQTESRKRPERLSVGSFIVMGTGLRAFALHGRTPYVELDSPISSFMIFGELR